MTHDVPYILLAERAFDALTGVRRGAGVRDDAKRERRRRIRIREPQSILAA